MFASGWGPIPQSKLEWLIDLTDLQPLILTILSFLIWRNWSGFNLTGWIFFYPGLTTCACDLWFRLKTLSHRRQDCFTPRSGPTDRRNTNKRMFPFHKRQNKFPIMLCCGARLQIGNSVAEDISVRCSPENAANKAWLSVISFPAFIISMFVVCSSGYFWLGY